MRRTKKKKILALCLTVMMIMTSMSGLTVSAAEESVWNQTDEVETDCIQRRMHNRAQNVAAELGEEVTEPAAKIGEKEYLTIYEAVTDAEQGAVIQVQKDIELGSNIWIEYGQKVTIDLGGYTLTQNNDNFAIVVIDEGSELILQNGNVTGTTSKSLLITSEAKLTTKNVKISGSKGIQIGDTGGWGEVVVEEGTEIEAEQQGIVVAGTFSDNPETEEFKNISKLTVNGGNISGKKIGISGNGSQHGTEITVHNGTIHGGEVGIYQPQVGVLNVLGGTITGLSGIEIRSGELNVGNDAVIKGIGAPLTVEAKDSGNTTLGAGIAVAQHVTGCPINVNIMGGTIQGCSALYESNPQKNEADAIEKVIINITDGKFETINGGDKAVYSEDVRNFVHGGNYSNPVEKEYLDEDLSIELKKADSDVPYSYYPSLEEALKHAGPDDVVTDLNDDSGIVIVLKNKYYDAVITIKATGIIFPACEHEGDEFLGWSDGMKRYQAGETAEITEDTVFTAVWKSTPVDKSDLDALITYAEGQKAYDEYKLLVPKVKDAYDKALAAAVKVSEDAAATQEDVNIAYEALLAKVHLLGFVGGDTTKLKDLYEELSNLNKELYTEESIERVDKALKLAEDVFAAGENALKVDIDKAYDALTDAKDRLERIPVDKTKLERLVKNAAKYEAVSDQYTPATAEIFMKALTEARRVLADGNAVQEDVDTAFTALQKAMFGLRLIPNKDKLEESIKNAEAVDIANYTVKSAKAFTVALDNAKAVFADENATEAEVKAAEKELEKAQKALVEKADADKEISSKDDNKVGNKVASDAGRKEPADKSAAKTGDDVNTTIPAAAGLAAILGAIAAWRKRTNA